ncbi:hypothetical protein BDC45DRAFT_472207, partial [Circinella umbellata]
MAKQQQQSQETTPSDHKVIFITGGSSGVGRSAVKQFVSKGHTVVFTGRSNARLEGAIKWIQPSKEERSRLYPVILDQESLESVRNAVKVFQSFNFPSLDILINNAGCSNPTLRYTADSTRVESTIFANTVAPWYLSMLLIPLMHPGSRILFIATGHHDPERKEFMMRMLNNDAILDPDMFDKLDGKENYTPMGYYKISKLAMIWIGYVLAKKYPDISVLSACPGFVPETDLGREMPWLMQVIMKNVMHYVIPSAVTAHQSASEYVYYTTSDKLE